MSQEAISSPARAAKVKPVTTTPLPGEEPPALQDLLAERTLAMIGGAPKPEVDRLATAEQARLAPPTADEPFAPAGPSIGRKNETQTPRDDAGASDASPDAAEGAPAEGAPDAEPAMADAEGSEAGPDRDSGTPVDDDASGPRDAAFKEPERFRFQSAEDRAVAQIARAKGISLLAAARLYAGDSAKPESRDHAPAEMAGTMGAATPEIAQHAQNVAAIEHLLDESGAHEGLWNPRIAALVKQHSKATAALEVARLAAEHNAAAAQGFENQRDAVLADAVKQYPDLGNKDSALWKVAAQMAAEAHDPSHPDHQSGRLVDAPRYFADKAAALLKVRPVAAAMSAVTAPAAGRSLPKPGPASGTKQTLPSSPAKTEQQKIDAAHAKTLALIGGKAGKYDDDPGNAFLVV